MNTQVTLYNQYKQKTIIVPITTDIVMVVLSVFGLAWIKMFIDGNTNQAIINLLLTYSALGTLIHGLVCAINRQFYIRSLIAQGYLPATQADSQTLTGLGIAAFN